MKKLFILIAILIIGAAGYYFTIGSQQVADELKGIVNNQLQILQQNGFIAEDKKSEAKQEHFIIHYADPDKISSYLQSHNMNLSKEEAEALKGLKIGVDLAYLQSASSAISIELYPAAFPPSLIQNADQDGKKILEKIIAQKIFLAHVDINKLLTSFEGYFKDIDTTFEATSDPVTLLSKGFTFGGTYDTETLTSTTNSIKEFTLSAKSGGKLSMINLAGNYKNDGATPYEYKSKQEIGSIGFWDTNGTNASLQGVRFESAGEVENNLSNSFVQLELAKAEITEPQRAFRLEGFKSKATLSNVSIAAIETMNRLDENDAEGYKKAFNELLSHGITLNLDEFVLQKYGEGNGGLSDGLSANAIVKIDKNLDITQIEQNPAALLGSIDAAAHIEFSDTLYELLQKQPYFTLASLLFTPIIKENKKIFDLEFKQGNLKVNGKSAL